MKVSLWCQTISLRYSNEKSRDSLHIMCYGQETMNHYLNQKKDYIKQSQLSPISQYPVVKYLRKFWVHTHNLQRLSHICPRCSNESCSHSNVNSHLLYDRKKNENHTFPRKFRPTNRSRHVLKSWPKETSQSILAANVYPNHN